MTIYDRIGAGKGLAMLVVWGVMIGRLAVAQITWPEVTIFALLVVERLAQAGLSELTSRRERLDAGKGVTAEMDELKKRINGVSLALGMKPK